MAETERRVTANRDVCVGSGLCAHVAPEYFDVSEAAVVEVLRNPVADEALHDVEEAVEACPTQALRLERTADTEVGSDAR